MMAGYGGRYVRRYMRYTHSNAGRRRSNSSERYRYLRGLRRRPSRVGDLAGVRRNKRRARREGVWEIEAQLQELRIETYEALQAHRLWLRQYELDEIEYHNGWYDYVVDDCEYYDTDSDDRDPEPTEHAWVALWVAGLVDDEYSTLSGVSYRRWWLDEDALEDECDEFLSADDIVDVDFWAPLVTEPACDRDMERYNAGERYFRQHKRTVSK